MWEFLCREEVWRVILIIIFGSAIMGVGVITYFHKDDTDEKDKEEKEYKMSKKEYKRYCEEMYRIVNAPKGEHCWICGCAIKDRGYTKQGEQYTCALHSRYSEPDSKPISKEKMEFINHIYKDGVRCE